jgi:virulence-associated protein VapD
MNESIDESKVRKVINTLIKQELISENKKYQKTIKEIEKTSKLAELTTKMEALDKAIEGKNSRLNSIEESEDLKELVDKKSMNELKKEVKLLEKYKNKVLKMYEKLTKTKNKEVIGEDTINEADGDIEDTDQMKKDLEDIKKTVDDISKTELFEEDENIDIAGIISKKYTNISNEDIKSFIDMHSQDINTEEDVMDEFEEFLTVNPGILNRD